MVNGRCKMGFCLVSEAYKDQTNSVLITQLDYSNIHIKYRYLLPQ